MKTLVLTLFFTLLASLTNAQAEESWTFTSKYDRFTLIKNGSNFFYDGEAVQGSWAEDLRPVLENDMNIECETLPKKPDLRLTWDRNGQVVHRQFFLKEKMVTDGKNCLELTGQGVYYAPFHKSWFVGSEKLTIALSKGFEIGSELETWAKIKSENGRLVPADPDVTINWETLTKLQSVLRNFPIEGRAHATILFDDPERNLTAKNVILKAAGKTYKFRQIKGGTWLLELPNIPWLVLSPNFGLFDTMNIASWVSENDSVLTLVKNNSAKPKDRIAAVKSLRSKTSKDVFAAFHSVLLDSEQNEAVKSEIIRALRNYPSEQNMAVLTMALEKTDSPELMIEIIRVLKLRNPKGPQIETNADPDDINNAIQVWRKWAKPFEKHLRK